MSFFNFKSFVQDLRNNEQKKMIVTDYEKKVLKNRKIPETIESQKWFKNYLSNFTPVPDFKVPEDLKNEFDWNLLFKLVAGSLSSDYDLQYPTENENRTLPDLIITVESNSKELEKKVSELWSFQIMRLFEIYIEEYMQLESKLADGEREILEERNKKINSFKSNILRENKKNETIIENNTTKKKDYVVYHYCNLNSAVNIIKSGYIFNSDLTYMNDRDEMTIGKEAVKRAFETIYAKHIDKDFCEWLENKIHLINDLDNDIVFISCYSRKRDDLNQWRAYGDNGYGICLVFDFEITLGDSETENFWIDDITYLDKSKNENDNAWISFINKVEKSIYKIYSDLFKNADKIEEINDVFSLPTSIKTDARLIKNASFKEEEEFRCISLNENKKNKINLRVGKKYIIPYIEMKLSDVNNNSVLKEIIIGPSIKESEKSKKSIEYLLEESGFDNNKIIISYSKIPYNP